MFGAELPWGYHLAATLNTLLIGVGDTIIRLLLIASLVIFAVQVYYTWRRVTGANRE